MYLGNINFLFKPKKNENIKMVMWDYKDTELPFNTTDRSPHMKDMGGKGWELVSVSPNPESRCFVFFWKRPQNLAFEKENIFCNSM